MLDAGWMPDTASPWVFLEGGVTAGSGVNGRPQLSYTKGTDILTRTRLPQRLRKSWKKYPRAASLPEAGCG